MTLEVIITRDYEHMSDVSATILIPQITVATRQQKPKTVHVGLPTGSSPVGLKDHIVNRQEEFLGGMVEWSNPDEYVDLPGNTPFERASHPSSYRTEMDNFYRRLNQQPLRIHNPRGTKIDITRLLQALAETNGEVKMVGNYDAKAIDLSGSQHPYLRWIKRKLLDGYVIRLTENGPIDWQVLGAGRNGHIGFHERGIPLGYRIMLVQLDEQTRIDAYREGHFASQEEVPRYALTIGAMGMLHFCRNVLFLGSGEKRTEAVAKSLLDGVSPDTPLSVLQNFRHYKATDKKAIYVVDEIAAAEILGHEGKLREKGITLTDLRQTVTTSYA